MLVRLWRMFILVMSEDEAWDKSFSQLWEEAGNPQTSSKSLQSKRQR